ncbi:MAG: hypothetical protein SF069_04385 [Phycisphaerae bacterium]|nr:hypothetical protein [Phycisphaerae bacterium]
MKKILATAAILSLGASAAMAQVSARYFLSTAGLADPNDTQSAASTAPGTADQTIDAGANANAVTRLYLWADLSPGATSPLTDLKGIDIALAVNGNLSILASNLWQRVLDDGGTPDDTSDDLNRWASAPGLQNFAPGSQNADPATTVAVLEPGLTTRTATTSLDNQDRAGGLWLFGWIEVQGNQGDIQIRHQASGFLQGTGTANRIFLGFDDAVGGEAAPAVPPGTVTYDNASPEATITPEPASLAMLALAALGIRRR